MAAIDQGKKMGVRWSGNRYKSIEKLGWQDLDEGAAIDKALERSELVEDLAYKIDRAFRGEINLLELVSQLNQVRKYK